MSRTRLAALVLASSLCFSSGCMGGLCNLFCNPPCNPCRSSPYPCASPCASSCNGSSPVDGHLVSGPVMTGPVLTGPQVPVIPGDTLTQPQRLEPIPQSAPPMPYAPTGKVKN